MLSSEPRVYRRDFGWPVDLARDRQSNCRGCGAPVYWVKILTKTGEVKARPMSEALAKRDGAQVYLSSHFADCPHGTKFQTTDKEDSDA